jgi:hypothetical protein
MEMWPHMRSPLPHETLGAFLGLALSSQNPQSISKFHYNDGLKQYTAVRESLAQYV